MKRGMKIFFVFVLIIVILFIIRLISPTEIDDLSPGISCPELEIYDPDILYVIPSFNSTLISENGIWCEDILSLNKTLGIHGINHSPYREFYVENISQEELDFAIEEFDKCFNQTPENFKPPQLKISKENKNLIRENNLSLKLYADVFLHKVYHCSDLGKIKNKWIKIF